jgi:plasmid maintenance system killer protein
MVVVFKNEALREIYEHGEETGKPRYGKEIVRAFIRKIDMLASVENSVVLAKFQSLHLEALTREKKYKGKHSIRVNDKYRIILKIVKQKNGWEIIEVSEIHDLTDYH